VPSLDSNQIEALLPQLAGWSVRDTGSGARLGKEFKFRNFVEAVQFVNQITEVAEAEGHHPDLQVSWGRVGVLLWTHTAAGLTENDFVLAAKIDRLLDPVDQ
jgi:4a-hydroxytetrahydrobiopterin dehydratase